MRPSWTLRLSLTIVLLAVIPACSDDNGTNQNNNSTPDPCGEGWVHIPEGSFEMGMNEDDPSPVEHLWGLEISPRHPATLSAYCIQRTETTVEQYRECVDASACSKPDWMTEQEGWCNYSETPGSRERHPVNCVSWEAARQHCQWADGDLPTEAQWEKAARGTDQRYFPWGNEPVDCSRANFDVDGPYSETPQGPVGEHIGCLRGVGYVTWEAGHITNAKGDSPYGLKDMAGNVKEWILDCINPLFYSECTAECTDPVNMCDSSVKGVRGGSITTDMQANLTTVSRSDGADIGYYLGFRCARPFTN